MTPSLKKRFWKDAGIRKTVDGFSILLDARSLKTPAKADFVVPTETLAEAIAQEWRDQSEKVNPATMPMTRRANAAIDKVTVQRREVADLLADYGGSDLLCYRAEQPIELITRQAEAWDPLLVWAAAEFGATLRATNGVMPIRQDADSLSRLREAVHQLPVYLLTGFHDLVSLSGSLIIGFAAIRGYADHEQIWNLSRIDEVWQEELWGADDEATKAAALKKQDFFDALRFFKLAGNAPD